MLEVDHCNNCIHYKPNEHNDGQNGLCRRHPPSVDNEGAQRHPVVKHDDRCGEFSHLGNLNPGECFSCMWFQAFVGDVPPWLEKAAMRVSLGKEDPEIGYCAKSPPRAFVLEDHDGDEQPCFQVVVTGDYYCGAWLYDHVDDEG